MFPAEYTPAGRGKTVLDPQLVEAIGGDDVRTLRRAADKLNKDFGLNIRTSGMSRKQLAYNVLRGMEEAANIEGAVPPAGYTPPTGKEIILRGKPGSLARVADPLAEAVDGGATSAPRLNYRIHQVAGTSEVSGPSVLKRDIPFEKGLVRVTPPSTAAAGGSVPSAGKWLSRGKGVAKWGGRALGVLAVADLVMQAIDATQGREDRLRGQRAMGSEADLRASAGNVEIRSEENRARLLDDALMFNKAADTAGVLGAQTAAAQQVRLEIQKHRSDLLGMAMRSEPTAIEQVAAMQQFMGAR